MIGACGDVDVDVDNGSVARIGTGIGNGNDNGDGAGDSSGGSVLVCTSSVLAGADGRAVVLGCKEVCSGCVAGFVAGCVAFVSVAAFVGCAVSMPGMVCPCTPLASRMRRRMPACMCTVGMHVSMRTAPADTRVCNALACWHFWRWCWRCCCSPCMPAVAIPIAY